MTTTNTKEATAPINGSDAAAIIASVRQGRIVDIGAAVQAAILQPGESLESVKELMDEYLPAPERLKGETVMDDLASFLNECDRFKNETLTVYVRALDPSWPPSVVAVFNDCMAGKPAFRDHRTVYAPEPSVELKQWLHAGKAQQSQEAFAELIEERFVDVRMPDRSNKSMEPLLEAATQLGLYVGTPAELLEVSRGLQINLGGTIKGRPNLLNGNMSIVWEQSDVPSVTVPGAVVIEVPFFQGAEKVLVLARIRYRHEAGKITWRVLLHDLPAVYREAVEALCSTIREPGHRVVLGEP